MFSLAESSMSDEDKRDTELLKQIYLKMQKRSNAILTPEEKDVLTKYGLQRDRDVRSIRNQLGQIIVRQHEETPDAEGKKEFDVINYADRARKLPDRAEQAKHLNGVRGITKTYQDSERDAENRDLTKNVDDMKLALKARKQQQAYLDNYDEEQEAKINKLKAEYEQRIANLKQDYQYRKGYAADRLNRANDKINTLLKKEEN